MPHCRCSIPAKAAGELDRAVTQLGLRGALVNGHTLGHYLDEPQFDIVWERLEALHVPLYTHPGAVLAGKWYVFDGYPALSGPTFGWAAATGAHLLRLIGAIGIDNVMFAVDFRK